MSKIIPPSGGFCPLDSYPQIALDSNMSVLLITSMGNGPSTHYPHQINSFGANIFITKL